MSFSLCLDSSSAPAAASSTGCVAPDACLEAALASPVNGYGYREGVSQEDVNRLLERAGVVPRVALAGLESYGGVLAQIQRHAREVQKSPSLYCFKGADVPALVPAALGAYPLWYIRLPDAMQGSIARLVRARLQACVGETDNPWVRASYLQIASGAVTPGDATPQCAHAFVDPAVEVEVRADLVNSEIDLAAQKGCILVAYECAGWLTLTGYALDEGMLLDLQVLQSSTFFKPARAEPWAELQARTRQAEDGQEKHQASGGGAAVRIAGVFSLARSAAPEAPVHAPSALSALSAPSEVTGVTAVTAAAPAAPGTLPAQAGGIFWACWMEPAGVGRLGKVLAYVPPALLRDRQVWLRGTVTPELFASLQDHTGRVWVERVWLANEEGQAFVVVVQSDAEMAVIALKVDDARFAQAYGSWAGAGVCPLAIENLRNGRMLALALPWPEDFTGSFDAGDESAAERWLRLGQRTLGGLLHEDWAVREVAERVALSAAKRLRCGFSDATDELGWALDAQLAR